MKRWTVGLAAVALCAVGMAQDAEPKTGVSRPKVTESGRMGALWSSYQDRMANQIDHDFEEGDFPKIIQLLKVQADMNRQGYETWTDLIWMLGNVEQFSEQIATARQFRNYNVKNPEAWYPEAEIYFIKRSFVKVIPIMEEAIKLEGPIHPNTYRILANSWTRLGFKSEAIRVWEMLLKRYPNDERARVQLERLKKG